MTSPQNAHTPRYDLIALVIIGLSLAIRYWFVASNQLNLVQDEAQYWDWIRRPQLSYYSKGPLIAWMIQGWTAVFGNTELGVRFGSIIGMAGIQAGLYVGVSRVWRESRLALAVLFVAATMPLLNGLGILATTDNPLILCWTIAFFALAAATRNEPDRTPGILPFVILGVCVAVGILAKYMMLTFLGLALIHVVILQLRGQLPRRFWARFIIASLIGAAVGLAPIVAWNMDNDWVAYRHVAKLTTDGPGKHTGFRFMPFLEMLGAQIGLLAPWWFVFILAGTLPALKKAWVGPVGRFDAVYRRELQTLLYFWPLWAGITLKAMFSKVEANWTAVAFMAGALLGGAALLRWWDAPKRKPRGRMIMAGTAAIFTAIIFLSPLAPLPDNVNPTHRLKGWADLGRHVEQLRQTEFTDPEKVFVFSDNYGITSELAFYVPGQPITFCAWIQGRRMNQYDLWPGPGEQHLGWDAVMIRPRDEHGVPGDLHAMFTSVSDPIPYHSSFQGGPGRLFNVILCRGFKGFWPQRGLGKY